ncbi:hypothetical protein Golomagni_03415 [Golovinomyces magnicellulatus]|nr:hypothetical protein Golomagni_03415 [Golovinomyces magnicellulatus]
MMNRSVLRPSFWRTLPSRRLKYPVQNICLRRYQSDTARPKKHGTWKSTLFRWAVVVGGVYYYTKSDLFAVEREGKRLQLTNDASETIEDDKLLHSPQNIDKITIEAILERKNQQNPPKLVEEQSQVKLTELSASQVQNKQSEIVQTETVEVTSEDAENSASSREGAFDPETGKINWDCPCLGGMAHGPCGEEFKAAFSCFVYSEEEPKGVECIEKFKTMQNCFRQYPEIYGSELDDDTNESESESEGVTAEKNTEDPEKIIQEPEQSQSLPPSTPRSTEHRSPLAQQSSNDSEKSDTTDEKDESIKELSNTTSS